MSSLDQAIGEIRASPYFEPFFRDHATVIVRYRNDLPCDSEVVYRHRDGACAIQPWLAASRDDPVGLLVTGPWLPSATQLRNDHMMQRYVFGLHDLCAHAPFGLHAYRVVCDDHRVSWQAVVLDRDGSFTWVLFFWFQVEAPARMREVSSDLRVGLSSLAPLLGQLFELHVGEPCYRGDAEGSDRGLLVFDRSLRQIRRQDFKAEMSLRELTSISRASCYTRIRLEYERRVAAGLPPVWTVDAYCQSRDQHRPRVQQTNAALEIEVEADERRMSRVPERVVKLRQLQLPRPPMLESWRLEEHRPAGLATSLKKLRDATLEPSSRSLPAGYFIKAVRCIARPVWDTDMIAGRVQRYPQVEATKLARKGSKAVDFETYPICALLFRSQVIGILQAV